MLASPQPLVGWPARRRLWWRLWCRCPGLGWQRLQALEQGCGSLEEAWRAPRRQLEALPGWGARLAEQVVAFRLSWGDDPLCHPALHRREDRRLLLPGDPSLPPAVRWLERPPLALHWRGRGSLWAPLRRRQAVAVVGTRRPSLHGLSVARQLGEALAGAGWPVVSGLAEGIDGAVHDGCLRGGGAPVAVLGTPLDRVYPRHHDQLQQQVGERGLLVTEQLPGAAVRPGHFAERNRLQVALAAAVVVVECPERSGALHSAERAWREGLPLWVVPADTGKPSAAGSNRLLARGATPLLEPGDLICQLGPGPLARKGAGLPTAIGCGASAVVCSEPAQALVEAVGAGASLEQLCHRLDRPADQLVTALLQLELAGVLQAEPGLCWRPS
ncbi:DNA-processing protein DprA [Synechococcus sp. CCY9202]|uniref:DNA-processing protein DprA n=1 Tax=Synechococcus sp. CCY9202 TaxID=174698 RepID=UPI002B210EFF|nr:DNA-processing protein DprA [Synechococcus sp. CCY9202]